MYYSLSCEIHAKIVTVKSVVDRRKKDKGKKKFMNRRENKQKTNENKEEAKLV